MIVLADNDLIIKLAQCDLLDDLESLLCTPLTAIYVAPTTRYQILRPSKKARYGGDEVYSRLIDFFAKTAEIPAIENTDRLTELAIYEGIDSGEQILFAAMLETKQALLLTGDKKALTALIANQNALTSIFSALTHKVIIFESILLLSLNMLGFDALKQKLLNNPNPQPDGLLKLIVRPNISQDDFVECLCSYAKEFAIFLSHQEQLPSVIFEVGR